MVAVSVPSPREFLPSCPDAIVDLQTHEGVALVGGEWRYSDTKVRETDFVAAGPDLSPSGPPNRTYEVVPHAQSADFDDSAWLVLAPPDTQRRLSTGRVCFNWYRITVTVPRRIGDFDTTGSTVIFEVVTDDYVEVWVNGAQPIALGDTGGHVVGGFNAPNRVVLTRFARPGQSFVIAVFGINGPISASPANYIWMRSATLDFYAPCRARTVQEVPVDITPAVTAPSSLEAIVPSSACLERVACGFEFTSGPVWARDSALLFSSPNTNVIYRWNPVGLVTVFRPKSGYAGADIGKYPQPGSNGLTFDPDGHLTICQRIWLLSPHGEYLGILRLPENPHNLAWGDEDGCTLYVTALTSVYRIRLAIPGVRPR